MVAGKARLVRDDYCDGLGDCLPACPTGAISFEEREADAYDEAAVAAHLASHAPLTWETGAADAPDLSLLGSVSGVPAPSQLAQWPCQIKLVPVTAPYFQGADLLVAADCTAFAYASLHRDFMAGRVTLIGCPKLDGVDYAEKLGAILRANDVRSVTLARMEVPCCGGLAHAAQRAVASCGRDIPLTIVTIARDGRLVG